MTYKKPLLYILIYCLLTLLGRAPAFAACDPEDLEVLGRPPHTPGEWRDYNQQRLNEAFNRFLPEFISKYHNGNTLFLNFLNQASGNTLLKEINRQTTEKINSLNPSEFKYSVKLPALEQIIKYYNDSVDRLIKAGAVPGGADYAVRVGRMFLPYSAEGTSHNKSKINVVRWTNHFMPDQEQPYSGNRNSLIYDYTFGELGLFMVSDAQVDLWSGMPQTLHDLAHLASMLEYPKMMAAWRDFSRTLYRNKELTDYFRTKKATDSRIPKRVIDANGKTELDDDGNPKLDRDREGKLMPMSYSIAFVRGVISFEYMSRVKDVSIYREKMLLPKTGEPHLTVAAVEQYLQTVPQAKKISTAAALLKLFPKTTEYIGGATIDVIGNDPSRAASLPGYEISIDRFMNRMKNSLTSLLQGRRSEEPLDTALARLQVALVEFHKLEAPDWVRELKAPRLAPDSPLRKIVCETGLYAPDTFIYEAVCL